MDLAEIKDKKIAVLLSGGVDSSVLAIQEEHHVPVHHTVSGKLDTSFWCPVLSFFPYLILL